MIDYLMVTAMASEFEALQLQFPFSRQERAEDGTFYFRGHLNTPLEGEPPPEVVLLLIGATGRVPAAGAVAKAIGRWQPRNVLLIGVAGGVSGRVALGDVLVADQIVDISYRKVGTDGEDLGLASQAYRSSPALLAQARAVASGRWAAGIRTQHPEGGTPSVHFGPIASSDALVRDPEYLEQVRKSFRALIGIEMEGGGVAAMVEVASPRPEFLMIRGVADLVGPGKDDRWHGYAASAVATFAIALVELSRKGAAAGREPQIADPAPPSTGRAAASPIATPGWTRRGTLRMSRDAGAACLRVDEYAQAIQKLFQQARGEFCFGIFGHWGRGKTYLMKRVEVALQGTSQKYRCVWFKAWKYPTTPELWVHLYETLALAAESGSWLESRARTFRTNIVRHGLSPLFLGLLGLALMLVPLSAYLHLGTPARLLLEMVGVIGVLRIIKLFRGVKRTVADLSEKYLTVTRHSDRLGLQEVIGRDLTALLNGWIPLADDRDTFARSNQAWLRRISWPSLACLAFGVVLVAAAVTLAFWPSSEDLWIDMMRISMPSWLIWVVLPGWLLFALLVTVWVARSGKDVTRIALFIDDLDRCAPEQLLQVIESLKLLLEEPAISDRVQVAFLIEEEILARTIITKYRGLLSHERERAATYSEQRIVQENIEKLIIAHLRLPPLSAGELGELLDSFARPRAAPAPAVDGPVSHQVETRIPSPSHDSGNAERLAAPVSQQQGATEGFVYGVEEFEALRGALEILCKKEGAATLGPRALQSFLLRYQLARLLLSVRGAEPTPERLAHALANAWGTSPSRYFPGTGDADLDAVTLEVM